jgi:hypothetical protein
MSLRVNKYKLFADKCDHKRDICICIKNNEAPPGAPYFYNKRKITHSLTGLTSGADRGSIQLPHIKLQYLFPQQVFILRNNNVGIHTV